MSALAEPPLTPKAAATRERLLDLSAKLFIERGYDDVSLRDIADEAHLTKGAIYGHFRSKGQLLVDVIRSQLAARDAQFDLRRAAEEPGALFELFISPGSRELRLLQVDAAAAARHDPDVASGTAEIYAERSRRIHESLEGVDNAQTILFLINALSSGVGMQEAHGREVPDADTWRRTLGAMFGAAFRPSVKPEPTDDMIAAALTEERPIPGEDDT